MRRIRVGGSAGDFPTRVGDTDDVENGESRRVVSGLTPEFLDGPSPILFGALGERRVLKDRAVLGDPTCLFQKSLGSL